MKPLKPRKNYSIKKSRGRKKILESNPKPVKEQKRGEIQIFLCSKIHFGHSIKAFVYWAAQHCFDKKTACLPPRTLLKAHKNPYNAKEDMKKQQNPLDFMASLNERSNQKRPTVQTGSGANQPVLRQHPQQAFLRAKAR